jgi:pentatricopeptide repeat protein
MQQLLIKAEYASLFENQEEQNKYLIQLLNYDDQQPITYLLLGANYRDMRENDRAIQEFEKGIGIYEKWGLKPEGLASFYNDLMRCYYRAGRYEEMKKVLKRFQKDCPGNRSFNTWQAIYLFRERDSIKANSYVEKSLANLKQNSAPEGQIITSQILIFSQGGMTSKAKEYCRKLLTLQTASMQNLNNAAWNLLEDDRTINEALELAERSLDLYPGNNIGLHRKGWALYKLGRYDEALELIQQSWDIRMKEGVYNHETYLHLQAAKKAVANLKNY